MRMRVSQNSMTTTMMTTTKTRTRTMTRMMKILPVTIMSEGRVPVISFRLEKSIANFPKDVACNVRSRYTV